MTGRCNCLMICVGVFILYMTSGGEAKMCQAGQFLNIETGNCGTCPPGTFQSHNDHTFQDCRQCSVAHTYLEIVEKPCSPTTNTVILCSDNRWRSTEDSNDPGNGQCKRCSKCPKGDIVVNPCGQYNNTVCRSGKDPTIGETTTSGMAYSTSSTGEPVNAATRDYMPGIISVVSYLSMLWLGIKCLR